MLDDDVSPSARNSITMYSFVDDKPLYNINTLHYSHIPTATHGWGKFCINYLSCITIVTIIIGYYCLGILSLICNSYSDSKKLCNQSNLWIFTIASLLIRYPINVMYFKRAYDSNIIELKSISCAFITIILFMIWGSLELWLYPCSYNQYSKHLYKLLQVDMGGQLAMLFIAIGYINRILILNRRGSAILI